MNVPSHVGFTSAPSPRRACKRHLDLMFVIRFGHQDAPYEGTQGFREAKGLKGGVFPLPMGSLDRGGGDEIWLLSSIYFCLST